jgi:hypothetical protein
MKNILFTLILIIVVILSLGTPNAKAEDPGISAPVHVAKEYMAAKIGCDISDLKIGDTLIGHRGAHIDIKHGYNTERVYLRYNEDSHSWEADSSMPLHPY